MHSDRAKQGISILIVEDDQIANDLTRRMISMQFPELIIYQAENGVVGEELFHRHAPDILITDVAMPFKDGIELARDVKSSEPGTRLIVVSAHNDHVLREQFQEIGIDSYLSKPLDFLKLMAALQGCLEEIQAARTPATSR